MKIASKFALLIVFLAPFAFAEESGPDPYRPITEVIAELTLTGQAVEIEMQRLSKEACQTMADNIKTVGGEININKFVKDCTGTSVSITEQVEQPELPNFASISVVTYINYGNLEYAVDNPELFFVYGMFSFPNIVERAKRQICSNLIVVTNSNLELVARYMVNDLLGYDVRATHKEMGIVSVRYFLDRDSQPFYPQRHDFNFHCDE